MGSGRLLSGAHLSYLKFRCCLYETIARKQCACYVSLARQSAFGDNRVLVPLHKLCIVTISAANDLFL